MYLYTEDLSLDWIANNLYWTDSFWARIEVMDLDSGERAELVRTGNHSIPRAIVVDPMNRQMFNLSTFESHNYSFEERR